MSEQFMKQLTYNNLKNTKNDLSYVDISLFNTFTFTTNINFNYTYFSWV